MLDRYGKIAFDEARRRVTVEAGCHLGADPRDPTGKATWERSLLAALEARGWALPDLGGVTHQTVSGFLMTGSSGGSVQHAVEDAVIAIRFIDGLGQVHHVERGKQSLFDAVLCSMGLLGVVSTITLQCVPRFDVVGREDITPEDATGYGLFDPSPRGLAGFLRRTEYSRLMWWPQKGVERVVTWQARRMTALDYNKETGPRGALVPRPYQALGDDVPRGRLARPVSNAVQWAGGKFYDALDSAGGLRAAIERRLPAAAPLARAASEVFSSRVLPQVLGQFVPLDVEGPQRFWDRWCDGLPMDNQMSDASLPTTFTEIFVPLDEAGRAMSLLREHFRAGGIDATGTFIFEIYAARATRGWMHPAYQRDSLRIDVFWFERSRDNPTAFFEQFWDLFAPLGYRLHWGKHLPADRSRGARYLRKQYPRWDDFLRLRARLDPFGLFLNAHWRGALGLDDVVADPRLRSVFPVVPGAPGDDAPLAVSIGPKPNGGPDPVAFEPPPVQEELGPPEDEASRLQRGRLMATLGTAMSLVDRIRWPMPFSLGDADASLFGKSTHEVSFAWDYEQPPEVVHSTFLGFMGEEHWAPGFTHLGWHTPEGVLADAVMDEFYFFMAMRVRVIDHTPGRRSVLRVEKWSAPLATEMVQMLETEPDARGGTHLIDAHRLQRAARPPPPLHPPVAAAFKWWFEACFKASSSAPCGRPDAARS